MYSYPTELAENMLSIRKADDKQLGEHVVLTPPTTPVYTLKLKPSPLTQEDSAFDDCLYDESEWASAYGLKESVMWDSVMYEDSNYEDIDMADAFPMLSAIEPKSEPSEFGMNDDADSRIVQPTWPVNGREDTQLDVCGGVEEGGGIEGGDRGG